METINRKRPQINIETDCAAAYNVSPVPFLSLMVLSG